ncbi:hypothetical protein K492DRAFT_168470 [Lichtheimia hyalospora FSU 10163]|nr:hypothetical protein K492DRAFT_168470 [Lichtheimia hyalospora FSU 10163]
MDYFQHPKFVHTKHQSLRKCCGCVHLRVGAGITCAFWAGLSLYFAVISFQNSSPFYSYMEQAALVVYGVVNLVLAMIGMLGLGAVYLDVYSYVRTTSHVIMVAVAAVLVDSLINAIIFMTLRSSYNAWCIDNASNRFHTAVNSTAADMLDQDFYNCDRAWQDELKFGLLSFMMMTTFYASVYWAACFRSYRIKKAIRLSQIMGIPIDHHVPLPQHQMSQIQGGPLLDDPNMIMARGGGGVGAPPPPTGANVTGMNTAPPPPPPPGGNRPNIIVLNNERPSKNKMVET